MSGAGWKRERKKGDAGCGLEVVIGSSIGTSAFSIAAPTHW